MNVTEKEINKFIGLFWREDYERVCDFLSSKKVFGIYTLMSETDCHNDITVEEVECTVDPSGQHNISRQVTKQIRLHSYISKKDIDFVLSFISRYFENFKLIFSSSEVHIFVATTEDLQAALRDAMYIDLDGKVINYLTADLFFQGSYFAHINLLEDNADISDELWNAILSYSDSAAYMLSAYTSGKYVFPEKIGKRINDLYESLSDSDKLLLELGENI